MLFLKTPVCANSAPVSILAPDRIPGSPCYYCFIVVTPVLQCAKPRLGAVCHGASLPLQSCQASLLSGWRGPMPTTSSPDPQAHRVTAVGSRGFADAMS